MSDALPLVFGAPVTYVQREGILAEAGPYLSRLGTRMLSIIDPLVRDQVEPLLASACTREKIACSIVAFPGECTQAGVDALVATSRTFGPEMVLAAGGGKALDTGKLVAEALAIPAAMVPTIASTDAPTSRVAVLYTESHAQDRIVRLRANPALVLVDTAIIARAPVRFLVAGMGDALATWPEARACAAGGGRTPIGGSPSQAALALAELCYRTILDHGRAARQDVTRQQVTAAVERVIEANILLSGLGFESGGLAAAHSLYAGLSTLPKGAGYLHGEKVALGVLVQAWLEDWPVSERDVLVRFYDDVGLPTSLAGIGLGDASRAELETAVAIACRPGSHMHNLPRPVSPAQLIEVLEKLRGAE